VPTIREAVDALEERLFVGRALDLDAFRNFLEAPPGAEPQLLNVHGPGGVGKSALLGAFRRIAERAGRPVVGVDGRSVPAEPEAFLAAALGGIVGIAPESNPDRRKPATAKAAAGKPPGKAGSSAHRRRATDSPLAALAALNERKPLLLVDAFEELEELTRWLQEEFLPNLDTEVRVVVAGRFPMGPAWSDWQKIIRSIALRGLSGDDVKEYLALRGIEDAAIVQQVQSATGGLPLAVTLAADMVQQLGVKRFEAAPEWRLAVRSLVERLLAEVPDPDLREVLEAGSVVRQFDEATLAATLGREDISVAFDRLCRLSVVRPSEHGLMLHDDLRRMLAEDLRWRKPERYRDLRLAALGHLRERARTAPPGERAWLVAERLYLWGNEVVQSILFREDEPGLVYVEPGRPEDVADALAVRSTWLRTVLPSQQAMDYSEFTERQDQHWIERLLADPQIRLRVARDQQGTAIGFHASIPIFAGSVDLLRSHPLYAILLRAYFGRRLETLPERAEDSHFHFLVQAAHTDTLPEATEAALLRDLVGLLARGGVFLTITSVPGRRRLFEALGFQWIEGARQWVWDREHPADGYVLDLSVIGVEAWIEAIVTGGRTPRPVDPEELEPALRELLLGWEDDEAVAASPVAELVGGPGEATAGAVRTLVRAALERARNGAAEDRELALRAVELAYMERGVSHERAAERMRVSRSTFYRLLRRGTQSLAATLAGR
jgi:DNA-directed RNA polymerase specialized sigma24 family protein